jgi:ligand-binding sensor domain-containing protein/two-component sensor histidine kinase
MFFLTLSICTYCQAGNYNFQQYSTKQGLSQNTVHSIVQDSRGYLWISSRDGLNRFDGYEIKRFYHLPSRKNSLSNNAINSMCESKAEKNTLWIATSIGLNKFNTYSNNVEQFFVKDGLPTDGITYVYEDSKGYLWIGSIDGLTKLDVRKKKIIQCPNSSFFLNGEERYILSIVEAPAGSGNIWAATVNKLINYNSQTKTFRSFYNKKINRSVSNQILCLECYQDSLLFIGSSKGITILNITTEKYDSCLILNKKLNSDNDIRSIQKSPYDKDKIWIATFKSLYQLNFRTGVLVKISSSLNNKQELSCQYIFEDKFRILWLGTYRWGVFKITENKNGFDRLDEKLAEIKYPLNTPLWSIYKSPDGVIWVGANNGLYKIDFKNKLKKLFLKNLLEKESKFYSIRAIVPDSKNKNILWIGTLGTGLIKFDYEKEIYKHFSLKKEYPGSGDNIYSVIEDSMGRLWIGSNGEGLYQFDKQTAKFTNYRFVKESVNSNPWVTSISESRTGCLWIGTFANGIFKYDPVSSTFQRLPFLRAVDTIMVTATILSLYEDESMNLWIGTMGDGLHKYSIKEKTTVNYTTENGLPDNVIFSIIRDKLDFLWLTSNRGLTRFYRNSNTFINYFIEDGLKSNDFNMGAAFAAYDGELFFGSNFGFNSFYPDSLLNIIPPVTQIASFIRNNESIFWDQPPDEKGEIEFAYNENSFNIGVVGLHYLHPRKNQIKYCLEGYDKKWIYKTGPQEVFYNHLNPGKYLFRVYSANSDGIWDEKGKLLSIIILQPYWKTWWFYTILFVLFILIITSIIKARVSYLVNIEKTKYEERERIRKSIAQDLHDELGASATQITFLSNIIKNKLNSEHSELTTYIEKMSEQSQKLFNEIKTLNWEIDPDKDSLFDLIENIIRVADQLFCETDIAFEFIGSLEEFKNVKLPVSFRKHIFRIFKEAMHNVFKHSTGCKNCKLEIRMDKPNLSLWLSDDGPGFNINEPNNGYGLKNMKKRAAEIYGELKINSVPGSGTNVSLSIKLS